MQPYEPSRAHHPHLNHSQIPGMRPPYDRPPGGGRNTSQTPIYDSLYAEYNRLFRTLPGDRSGEENLRFQGFGTVHGTGSGSWSGTWQSPGRNNGAWYDNGRPRHGHSPAALPPGSGEGHEPGL